MRSSVNLYLYSVSRSGRMVIVLTFHAGCRGSIPRKVEMLEVSVTHNVKIVPANVRRAGLSVLVMWKTLFQSLQGDDSHRCWVSFLLGCR